jgi:hypothetical protein
VIVDIPDVHGRGLSLIHRTRRKPAELAVEHGADWQADLDRGLINRIEPRAFVGDEVADEPAGGIFTLYGATSAKPGRSEERYDEGPNSATTRDFDPLGRPSFAPRLIGRGARSGAECPGTVG